MLVVSATMVERTCLVLKMVFLIKFYQKIQRNFSHVVLGMLLAVGDMVKNGRFLKDSMDTTYDIFNLI